MLALSRYNVSAPLDDGGAVLANTLSGTRMTLSPQAFEAIERVGEPGQAALPDDLEAALQEAGMLVPVDLDELSLVREREQQQRDDLRAGWSSPLRRLSRATCGACTASRRTSRRCR